MESSQKNELELFIEHCKNLDFEVPDMQYYSSVALCAFDAIFSIRSNYKATVSPTIDRFCELIRISRKAPNPYAIPTADEQISVSDLAKRIEEYDAMQLADKIKNHSRTDTKADSILKTQAFFEYMEVFKRFGIETYQDLNEVVKRNPEFEMSLRAIRGQRNVAVTYFLMLAGDHNGVKVDTHLQRFVKDALGKSLKTEETIELFRQAADYYRQNGYPNMTPRRLDHIVWSWQKMQ